MSTTTPRRMGLPQALREARRLLGDFAFVDHSDGRYRIVRVGPCRMIEVVGSGKSLASALADAEMWLAISDRGSEYGPR